MKLIRGHFKRALDAQMDRGPPRWQTNALPGDRRSPGWIINGDGIKPGITWSLSGYRRCEARWATSHVKTAST